MLWDTHMHTHFSVDSDANPCEMAQTAITKGLDGICFTDHLDLTELLSTSDSLPLDLKSYFAEIKDLQSKFQNALPEYFYGKVEDEAYLEYFESILDNLAVFDCFDVYGHLDYIVRYGPNTNKFYSYEKYKDILDKILRTIIQKGKGIEINTGGFKYGLGHPNPTEEILTRYRELGGEIITIGADAHTPEHIAFDFHKIPQLLTDCGFRYYTVFKERKPFFYKL